MLEPLQVNLMKNLMFRIVFNEESSAHSISHSFRCTTMSSEYNNKLNSSDCLDCTETPAGEYIHQQRKNFSLFTCDLYSFALHIIQTTHTCASLLRSPSFVGRRVFVFIMQMFARMFIHIRMRRKSFQMHVNRAV